VEQARLESRREWHHSAYIVAVDSVLLKQVKSQQDEAGEKVIRSKIFLKETFFPDGDLAQVKTKVGMRMMKLCPLLLDSPPCTWYFVWAQRRGERSELKWVLHTRR
jgi:hypothetical protein